MIVLSVETSERLFKIEIIKELFEIINAAQAAGALVLLLLCVRYLWTEYDNTFRGLLRSKLAFGFTVFLSGEVPLLVWQWVTRYRINTGRGADLMSDAPWGYMPLVFGLLSVIGMACIARAIVPMVWGSWGYAAVILVAAAAVVVTQVIR